MDDKLNQTLSFPVATTTVVRHRIMEKGRLSSEEQAKLDAVEHRLADLTADMGALAQAFGRESERSAAHGLVTGCLECLLVDRLRPAGEALAALHHLVPDDDPRAGVA